MVINRLQQRCRGVVDVVRELEDVLGHLVNANTYMTPPGSQGFEVHFDWMDGARDERESNPTVHLQEAMRKLR